MGEQIIPICEDANDLHFEEKQLDALVSIDAYHYFAGRNGFFQDKILPFMKDEGVVLIGVPGLKDKYEGHAEELLSGWIAFVKHGMSGWQLIIRLHKVTGNTLRRLSDHIRVWLVFM